MTGSRRVLFAVPSAFPVGGLATWLDRLLPDLEDHGWETWLALPHGRWSDADLYLRHHPFSRVARFENRAATRIGRLRAVERVLDRVDPQVLVATNLVDVERAVAWRRAAGASTPCVIRSIHTLDAGLFADLEREDLAIDFLAAPNRLVEALARTRTRFPSDRVHYASYGVETMDAAPADEEPSSRLDLVYPGRFDASQKRILDLPVILGRLIENGVEWHLDLAGAGPLEAELLCALAPFGERVRWHGALTQEQVRDELLRPGRILVLCSQWELGPVVAWEAMARGLAVASSRFVGSGLEDSLRDGETGLLWEIGDLEGAVAALSRLRDHTLRARLMRTGWSLARKRYARAVAARAWAGLLEIASCGERRACRSTPWPVDAGRLDRILGPSLTDRARTLLGRPAATSGPGDEWPHSDGSRDSAETFLARAQALDRAGVVT